MEVGDDDQHNTTWLAWGRRPQPHFLCTLWSDHGCNLPLALYPYTASGSHLRLHQGMVVVMDCSLSLSLALFGHGLLLDAWSFATAADSRSSQVVICRSSSGRLRWRSHFIALTDDKWQITFLLLMLTIYLVFTLFCTTYRFKRQAIVFYKNEKVSPQNKFFWGLRVM